VEGDIVTNTAEDDDLDNRLLHVCIVPRSARNAGLIRQLLMVTVIGCLSTNIDVDGANEIYGNCLYSTCLRLRR